MTNYWLMKCEPEAYSIDDLKNDKRAFWEGVRNYQARNIMRDEMKVGDLAFYYHSNAKPSAIVGLMKIVKEGYADDTAFDSQSKYFDPKSKFEKPTWYGVDVEFIKKFSSPLPLSELRKMKGLENMLLLKKGSRLSIQPVTLKEFQIILKKTES